MLPRRGAISLERNWLLRHGARKGTHCSTRAASWPGPRWVPGRRAVSGKVGPRGGPHSPLPPSSPPLPPAPIPGFSPEDGSDNVDASCTHPTQSALTRAVWSAVHCDDKGKVVIVALSRHFSGRPPRLWNTEPSSSCPSSSVSRESTSSPIASA